MLVKETILMGNSPTLRFGEVKRDFSSRRQDFRQRSSPFSRSKLALCRMSQALERMVDLQVRTREGWKLCIMRPIQQERWDLNT